MSNLLIHPSSPAAIPEAAYKVEKLVRRLSDTPMNGIEKSLNVVVNSVHAAWRLSRFCFCSIFGWALIV